MREYTAVLSVIVLLVVATTGLCDLMGLDATPYTSRGQAMVPVHIVAEWLGAQAQFDDATGVFSMTHGDTTLQLRADDHHATVNGKQVPIDDRPAMVWSKVESRDGHLYVPMVFAAKALEIQAKWDTAAGGFVTLARSDADENTATLAQFPLHWAAANGQDETATMLLDSGVDVNTLCNGGWTALYWAAYNGHPEMARLLLDRGAQVNYRDTVLGWAPLHFAAYQGHTDTVTLLLDRGADPDIKNVWGESPLHWAARSGCTDAAAVLLDRGADVNATENGGVTPLHYAATYGHAETVELLLTRGANASATTYSGVTPLYWATRWGHDKVIQLLQR